MYVYLCECALVHQGNVDVHILAVRVAFRVALDWQVGTKGRGEERHTKKKLSSSTPTVQTPRNQLLLTV